MESIRHSVEKIIAITDENHRAGKEHQRQRSSSGFCEARGKEHEQLCKAVPRRGNGQESKSREALKEIVSRNVSPNRESYTEDRNEDCVPSGYPHLLPYLKLEFLHFIARFRQ